MTSRAGSTAPRKCPFCAQRNAGSKEHVWAEWLRNYPAFEPLVQAYGGPGRRYKRNEPAMRLNAEGRYQETVVASQHVGELLPYVTVPVCDSCNNGWMSNLETQAKSILHPLITGQSADIGPDQQGQLAGWVTKCFYAYTSTWSSTNKPFTTQEYLDLTASRRPPGRAFIWMGYSDTPTAQIAMNVTPLFLYPVDTPGDLMGEIPPGGAETYLAAHSVVFIGHWLPESMTRFYNKIIPRRTRHWRGLRRIWPPGPAFGWPPPEIPHGLLTAQRTHLERGFQAVAVGRLEGTTPAEAERATQDWAAKGFRPMLRRLLEPHRVRRVKRTQSQDQLEQEKDS